MKGGKFDVAGKSLEDDDIENKAVWSTAYEDTFEDNCFAACEPTGKKDKQGRTLPLNARHLPHHDKGNGASGTGGTVDLPHLRNALARMNQIKPVTSSIDESTLKKRAESHLIAHAKKEGIGDYQGKENIMDVEIKALSIKQTVEMADDSVGKFVTEVNKAVDVVVKEKTELTDSLAVYKSVFGDVGKDDLIVMKANGEAGKAYRESLTNEYIKLAGLQKIIKTDEESVKAEKGILALMSIDMLKSKVDTLIAKNDKDNPQPGKLPEHNGDEAKAPIVPNRAVQQF
jgi:hypothetical protein